MELAQRHLGPPRRGLEIGASAINPFPGLRAWNLDHPGALVFQAAQQRLVGARAPIDVFGSAERLPLRSGALDFVLASHVLEHLPDTIRSLREWSRVVRDGGTLFLINPHKERTFDRQRPRTSVAHHLADYALGMSVRASAMVADSHYHVWITADLLALIAALVEVRFLDWEILDVEDTDSKAGNGFTIVARKRSQPPERSPAASGPIAFHFLVLRLPFQVTGRTVEHVAPGAALVAPAGVPRGLYRATPIHAGFPPRAGAPFDVELGERVAAPLIEAAALEGSVLRLRGRDFGATTYLEALYPDGVARHALPELRGADLCLDTAGLVIPSEPFPLRAINLPPGGGASPVFVLELGALVR